MLVVKIYRMFRRSNKNVIKKKTAHSSVQINKWTVFSNI